MISTDAYMVVIYQKSQETSASLPQHLRVGHTTQNPFGVGKVKPFKKVLKNNNIGLLKEDMLKPCCFEGPELSPNF